VIEDGMQQVEEGLLERLTFGDDLADTAGRYLAEAGGKRLRPALVLLTAQLGDGNIPAVIAAAQALEITHLATLYHDDVMDDAPRRRGVQSAHGVWGNSVAILTGDLLFARASTIISRQGGAALKIQAETFERLVLGQLHETIGPRPDEDPIDHYIRVLADKTGSLIAAAAQMGLIFSNAPDEYEQPLLTYGENIGIAFQLIDDVIDLAPATQTGKTPGTDLLAGVATLPSLKLERLARTDASARDLLSRLQRDVGADAGEADRADLQRAVAELRQHPVTAETLVEAHQWAARGIDALDALPSGHVKKALLRFAEAMVERNR
jgi:heptaprenyl diphosphate synthase